MSEELIQQILLRKPDVSRDSIIAKLDVLKKKTGGFISDESLLRMIAAEFGVKILQNKISIPKLFIKDLIPSLNNVEVVGRVIAVFPSRVFEGNRKGKVASLLIADNSGLLRVVFWNDKSKILDSGEVRTGQLIRFLRGYTREDNRGIVELHIGEKSEVQINPSDLDENDFPSIDHFTVKICQIDRTKKIVNLRGFVKEVFAMSTFERQDSSSGKVMRFILADGTGEIAVVVWNEKVDEVEKLLKKDTWLLIVNAKVKKALDKGLEVHVNSEVYVEAIAPLEEFFKIANLKEGLRSVNVKAEVVSKPILREVEISNGEKVKLAVFEVEDETGRIWVSAWRKKAEIVKQLELGKKVVIKNAYVKKGFGDLLELSTKNTTEIAIID